jgi:hypothetical protein
MFSQHVTKNLSAYCHGEVTPEESRQISEHLLSCNRCRQQFEEIKLGVKLAERLPQLAAPDSLWLDLQSRQAAESHKGRAAPTKQSGLSFKFWQPSFVGVAAGLLLAAGLVVFWIYSRESRPFWEVARVNGTPKIGSSNIGERGKLGVGEWLETDNTSRAQIDVGSIGQVDIDPNTRVRLVETKPTEHRLELAHGKLSARIWAPPRLFFVDTPSAVAADLGCAYTLEVDDAGRGLLKVTSGWVALQLKGHESMVPAGAICAMRPGIGPGTPYFEDASETFRRALSNFDFDPRAESRISTLDVLLHEARPRDSLTLWHLLARVEGNDRERVYERLASFVAPPAGVTREGVLQLNEQMLQLWKDELGKTWGSSSVSGVRKAWIDLWTKALGKANGLQGRGK